INHAGLYLIINSKQTFFQELSSTSTKLPISKKRISLTDLTKIQAIIIAKEKILFNKNDELDEIFTSYRNYIKIEPYSVISLSNVVRFDDRIKKPFDIFI